MIIALVYLGIVTLLLILFAWILNSPKTKFELDKYRDYEISDEE